METRYKLIGEETLKELIKCRYRQGYMILLLAALCEKNRIETDITLHEGCGILGLTPREVLDATKRNQVRFIDHGGHRLFNASDFGLWPKRSDVARCCAYCSPSRPMCGRRQVRNLHNRASDFTGQAALSGLPCLCISFTEFCVGCFALSDFTALLNPIIASVE